MELKDNVTNEQLIKAMIQAEWGGKQICQDGGKWPACPICRGVKPKAKGRMPFSKSSQGHTSKCPYKTMFRITKYEPNSYRSVGEGEKDG